MPTLKELLAAAEKRKTAEANQQQTSRSILHGTGLTKKLAAKQNTVLNQDAKKSLSMKDLMAKTNTSQQALVANNTTEPNTETIETKETKLEITPAAKKEIILDPSQQIALEGMLKNQFACLIGAAGTGKTTVTKNLVEQLEENGVIDNIKLASCFIGPKREEVGDKLVPSIGFCAFTGRAVQQMKRALPIELHATAMTCHALLGYMPVYEDTDEFDPITGSFKQKMVFIPSYNEYNKLPYDVIIVDEGGMMPIYLWDNLLKACRSGTRIYIIGDINQLPPVQGRSVLGFAMLKWPTFTLEKIHRQAEDNPIIKNAHNILQGKFPQKFNNFALAQLDDGSIKAGHKIIETIKFLHQKNLFDPAKDALIVPQNVGALGQEILNERLVLYFNPPKNNMRVNIVAGRSQFNYGVGDKVMLLQNDRKRELTNGMTGFITEINVNSNFTGEMLHGDDKHVGEIDFNALVSGIEEENGKSEKEREEAKRQASHIVHVEFDLGNGEKVHATFSTSGQFRTITHAYAFTCHKSQGGEYDNVIIVAHSANLKMLTREWLYTAVTRAREKVIILSNDRGLAQAIRIQTIKGKTVAEKAQQFLALQDKSDTQVPDLPEPLEV